MAPWVARNVCVAASSAARARRSRRAEHQTGWVGYDTSPADSLRRAEQDAGIGYSYDTTTDWTTDNPYRTTDVTDTTEENRAFIAWAGFTLPSAIALVFFAYGIGTLGDALGSGWPHGLKVVAVAVVAQGPGAAMVHTSRLLGER